EQRVAVLAARQAHHHLVAGFDHVVVADGLADEPAQALFELVVLAFDPALALQRRRAVVFCPDGAHDGAIVPHQAAPNACRSSSIWPSVSGVGFGSLVRHSFAVSSSSSSTDIACAGVSCHTFGPSRASITARIGVPRLACDAICAVTRPATRGSPGRWYGITGTRPTFITKYGVRGGSRSPSIGASVS